MGSANSQNGKIHKRMRNKPTRRRNGDMPADFASSVDDPSPMQIPGSIKGGPGSCSRTPRWWRHPIAKSIRPPSADHGFIAPLANLAADGGRTPGIEEFPAYSCLGLDLGLIGSAIWEPGLVQPARHRTDHEY